jgi:outer membrane protein
MKNLCIAFNILLLVLVGILFYLHFSKPAKLPAANAAPATTNHAFKVAYFIMDSLDANYEKVKEARKETVAKEDALNSKIATLEKDFQQKAGAYDAKLKANQMSQAEFEAAQRDIAQMKDNIVRQKQSAEQELMELNSRRLGEIKKEIEEYLKEYNKDKGFNYIFMYDASSPFLYCDTAYNITNEVLEGLNKRHKKKP